MESIDITDVYFESPPALKAAGAIKLVDQIGICAMAVIRSTLKISGTISFGGAKSETIGLNSGITISVITTKHPEDRRIKDRII